MLDDVAVTAAVGGINGTRAAGQIYEGRAGLLQFRNTPVDVVEPNVDELADVLTRRLPAIADGKDLTDLPKREAGPLGIPDKGHSIERFRQVIAVARRSAARLWKQPFVFIEAQRLRRCASVTR